MDVRVHNNSLCNMVRAVAERVLYSVVDGEYVEKIQPDNGEVRRRLGYFRQLVKTRTVVPAKVPLHKVPGLYTGRHRTRAEQAVESLEIRPIEKRDANVKPFVKGNEKTLKPGDPLPRLIQCRTPRYVVSCAQYLKRLEKPIFAAIADIWDEVTVAKGLNADETGRLAKQKYDKYQDCAMIGLDASKFDKHVSFEMLRDFEHACYTDLFPNEPELRTLLSWQLYNKGVGRTPQGTVHYTARGCRMSGDINTSLGNCLIMCAMVHAYARHTGVRLSLLNNGDDCVVFMEKRDTTRFSDGLDLWFAGLGFIMVAEAPVFDLEKMVFCQCQPVWVDGNYRMMRDPRVAAAKDCRTVVDISTPKGLAKWAQCVGDCGAALTDGLPVSRAYYSAMQRLGGGVKSNIALATGMESGMAFLARRMNDKSRQISSHTRYSFWLAFGIVPDLQRRLESYYETVDLGYSKPIPLEGPTKSFFFSAPHVLWEY